MYQADKQYIQSLARGLKLDQVDKLDTIMGPYELKEVLKDAEATDFMGTKPWINLHTHSMMSDGKLQPEEWIQNALKWQYENHLERYIIALTDHDTINGLISVLKYVIKNHEHMNGLRIVLGCELSTSFENDALRRPLDFEILHYGVNPFDKSYVQMLKKQAVNRHKFLPILFDILVKKYPWLPINLQDFYHSSFYGANIQKGLGVNWLYNTMSYFRSVAPQGSDLSGVLDDLMSFGFQNQKKGLWYPVEMWLKFIQKHGGFASIAHPYRLLLAQKLNTDVSVFIPLFFEKLSKDGLIATELYYGKLRQMQAAYDAIQKGYQPANDTDRWIKLIQDSSWKYFSLATGGADNHGSYLGNSQYESKYQAWQNLIEYWCGLQPLIQQGYRLLGKEVTMGLPGPCMPIFDKRYDLGIGSPYGKGAQRIWDFFAGSVDKILLGPSGRTTKDAKHSPYVSDDEHPNPFFIPIESLLQKGLVTYQDISFLKCQNLGDCINFDKVENNFDVLLSKIHLPSKKTLSTFVNQLAVEVKAKNQHNYIADMQVQITKPIVEKNQELFLTGFTLGTPPDSISDQPRNWGFPVLNPDKLFDKKGGLGPAGKLWQYVIDTAVTGAKGGLRIDHFIGLVNPYVISTDPNIPNGRLYSSYDHPILKKYAFYKPEQFYRIIEKIVLPVLKKHGLTFMDLYPEDIGARPEQLDDVLDHFGLGRLVVAEFNQPQNPMHMYQLMNTRPHDIATLDTHDTPSIQMFFDSLNDAERYVYAVRLAKSLRFDYTDDLKSTEQLTRMQWAEMLTCPATRVQAFFTSWTGQIGRYNQPGNPDKWRLRCVDNFDEIYFRNLLSGKAYNPLDAIALAIYARGDSFYNTYADFVRLLRSTEESLRSLIIQWISIP